MLQKGTICTYICCQINCCAAYTCTLHIQAEECPKRQTKCHYCEMDMAMDALKEHQSYCGTRTESCLKCGNRIMLRDQARHEESNCTYPAPRSPPPARRSPLSRSPPPARRNNNAAAAAAHPAPAAGRARGARAGGDRLANRQQHRQQSPPHLPPPPPPAVAREARRGTGRGGSGVRQPKNRNNHNSSGMYNEDSEDLGYLLNQLDTPVGSSSRDRTGGFNPYGELNNCCLSRLDWFVQVISIFG